MYFPTGVNHVLEFSAVLQERLKAYRDIDLMESGASTARSTAVKFNYPLAILYKAPEYMGEVDESIDPTPALECVTALEEFYPQTTPVFIALSQLHPRFTLDLHRDMRWCHIYGHRIQVPIRCEGSEYISRQRRFKLLEGNAYETDNISPHYAENKADTSKLSLLIDLVPDDLYQAEKRAGRKVNRFALIVP